VSSNLTAPTILILQAFRNGRPKVTTASYNNAAEVSGVCQCHEPGILTGQLRVLYGSGASLTCCPFRGVVMGQIG
jgi:hypothetical protein